MKGLNQLEEGRGGGGVIVAPGHLGHAISWPARTEQGRGAGAARGRRPTDLVFGGVRAGGAWAETPGF